MAPVRVDRSRSLALKLQLQSVLHDHIKRFDFLLTENACRVPKVHHMFWPGSSCQMLTNHEDQSDILNPGRQRRDGVEQEALGRVVQVLEGEGRLIPLVRVDRSKAAGPGGRRY